MRDAKKLIEKYNNSNNYIIISEFPSFKQLKGNTGLSRYSQNTIFSLKQTIEKENRKTIVLANLGEGEKEEIYEYDNILVIRCLQRNNILSFLRLISYVSRFSQVKKILFEFEFAAYGTEKMSLAIPVVLASFALLGKKTYFALHQVVTDLSSLYIHLGLSKGSLRLKMIEKGLQGFYSLIGALSYKVIVLEEEFKTRLSRFVALNKIEVIPHGIEKISQKKRYTKQDLGYNTNDFIILLFGYVSWYKGVEDFIRVFNKLPRFIRGKRVKLVIAGGKSVAQKGKKHYEEYYNTIEKLASKSNDIILTGFVEEADIEKYYAVADLCVVPYKTFMSSSGPLSLAVSYQKPVIFSDKLKGYLKSQDVKQAFAESQLSKKELFIPIRVNALQKVITRLATNNSYGFNIKKFTEALLEKRNWKKLSNDYRNNLFSSPKIGTEESDFGVLTFYRMYDIIAKRLNVR